MPPSQKNQRTHCELDGPLGPRSEVRCAAVYPLLGEVREHAISRLLFIESLLKKGGTVVPPKLLGPGDQRAVSVIS
jgi:hypothetical protein